MNTSHRKFLLFSALLMSLLTCLGTDSYAQRRNDEEIQKIQDAKIAIITNRIDLTPEQSKDFWPIYNEYSAKKRDMHRSMRQLMGGKGASDDQAMSSLKEVQDLKSKQLELDKEYQARFLTVISARQLVELYKAERTFNEMLLQRLK